MMFGILLMVLIGVLVDRWFYGEWTLSAWNYFDQNILLDKVSTFGVKPWWWYITEILEKGIPPFSLLYVGSFFLLIFYKPKSPLTWSILPFIIVHSLIGHKEIRFVFPIIGFVSIITIFGFEIIQDKFFQNLTNTRF